MYNPASYLSWKTYNVIWELLNDRVVIGQFRTIAIMDVESVSYQKQSMDYEQELSVDMIQHAGDTMSKVSSFIFYFSFSFWKSRAYQLVLQYCKLNS